MNSFITFLKKHSYTSAFVISVGLSFLLYGNTLKGEFVYDDAFFESRQEIRDIGYLPKLWIESFIPDNPKASLFRPLVTSTFLLNFFVTGESTFGFHLVNILFNAIACFLLYVLVLKLFNNQLLAILTALIWAFFPIHTESVAYIKSRDEILSTVFLLLGWIAFIKATKSQKVNIKYAALSSIFYIFAVFSKEFAFFGIFLYLATYYLQKKTAIINTIRLGFFYVPPFLVYLLLRIKALEQYAFNPRPVIYANNPLVGENIFVRILTSFKIVYIYLQRTFLPFKLSASYYFREVEPVKNIFTSWEALFGILFIIFLLILIIRKRTRKNPLGIGAIMFLVSYYPLSQIPPLGGKADIVAERWMYFPTVGLAIILGYILTKLVEKRRSAGLIFFGSLLILYGARTITRNRVWLSERTLYESIIKDAPRSTQGYYLTAQLEIREGNLEKAKELLQTANGIYDSHPNVVRSLGYVSYLEGDYDSAEQYIKKSISLNRDYEGNLLYAMTLAKQGRCGLMIQGGAKMLENYPESSELKELMAVCFYKLGLTEESIKFFDWVPGETHEDKVYFIDSF
ncbi:hypothetical protein JXA63_02030 [Candidatus Woesebacteria bacterium]|nr:hypothetical protein [Candidatus Woesebacteria bacterium]